MNHIQTVRSKNSEVPVQGNFKVSRKSTNSILKRRESVKFPSQQSEYAVKSNSPTVRLDLSSSEALIDPASVFLSFDLTIVYDDATANYANAFLPHVDNLIRNVRVYSKKNRTMVEELNNYNRLSSVIRAGSQDKAYSKSVDTFRSQQYNVIPELADGNAAAAAVFTGNALKFEVSNNLIKADAAEDKTYSFCTKLEHVGVFKPTNKYLPLQQWGNTLHLEIDLEPADTALTTNGDAAPAASKLNYKLSNVNILCDLLYMNEAYTKSILNSKNDMIYNFDSWTYTQSVVSTQNGFYNLNFSHADIKSLLMSLSTSTEQPTVSIDYPNKHQFEEISQFSIKSNGTQHPTYDLDSIPQQANFFMKSLNRHCQNAGNNLTLAEYKSHKYLLGLDFEKDNNSWYSGLNTVGSDIVAKVNFKSLPVNMVIHWFALHSRAFIVSQNQIFVES